MKRVFQRFRSSGLLGLALLLAVLLGVLAVLQYRWVGQISADERDRMRKHLHGRADDFADDFNNGLTRMFAWLQVPPASPTEDADLEELQRYEHWYAAATHPELITAIYQIDLDANGRFSFRQFDRQLGRLVPVDWPSELTPIRAALKIDTRPLPLTGAPRATVARMPLLWPDVPAMLVPRPRIYRLQTGERGSPTEISPQMMANRGYTVALLNYAYIRDQWLPQLAMRYFPDDGGRGRTYVAVRSGHDVVYATPGALPTILKTSDVSESLWEIRFNDLGRYIIDRRPGTDPKDAAQARGPKDRQLHDRDARDIKAATLNLYWSRDERGRDDRGHNPGQGEWRVHLLDKSGSLEAAVARARSRNLVISFSVLVLLAASMSLVLLSSARARRLAAQQMEFVAGVSHELRTPLTVIRSAGENLADGIVQDDQQVRKYGALIATEGRRLTQMVEQVMTFAGLQAGRPGLDVRAVDPGLVVDEALVAMAPLVREQEAAVEADVPVDLPRMLADASAVSRCIQNLVGNALKYGGQRVHIRVSARAVTRLGGDQVTITVADDGPGIAARDLPHIFEPFYRGADAVARQIHGSGLGLSLVQRVMEELGGSVTVQTEVGRGSAFTLHLPVAPDATVPAAEAQAVGPRL